jgi:Fe-S-cluster containining protein
VCVRTAGRPPRHASEGRPLTRDLGAPLPPLDGTLLDGFRFECRPGCGLCCFAEPAVTRPERARLVQIEPELAFVEGRGSWSYLPHRPNGGACALLTGLRCRAHAARPAPCAMFPVTVHVSDRPQATLVLSCPGIDPGGLLRWARGRPAAQATAGLTAELDAADREWRRSGSQKELDRHRVRFRGSGAVEALAEWRAEWHRAPPWPNADDFPVEDPPPPEDGFDGLPLTFSPSRGRVALAVHPGGWELYALSEQGQAPESLGVVPPPESPPPMTGQGEQLLRGYVHYLVERDDAFDAALAEPGPEGPIEEAVAADVVRTAATALARAHVLQRSEGRDGPLDAADVWAGIRSTDAEWLDRPTVGRRF